MIVHLLSNIFTHPAFWWTVGGLLFSGVVLWIVSYFVASHLVYVKTLKRNSKDQWGRDFPSDLNERSVKMYQTGLEWAEQNKQHKIDVHIVNEGLNLYGEYYDFGHDRCVFVLSGRTEALKYGYYFAIPYAKLGFNVLVVDPRGHGMSDGQYNTIGFEESKDQIAWIRHLHENFGIKSVVLHGICIGSAGGMYALTSGNCPPIVKGIVAEGMFATFYESMKNHLIEKKKPVFIMIDLIDAQMKKYTGHTMKYGPINVIDKLDTPLLMLHSKKDQYSKADLAQVLFDKAGCQQKDIVWFSEGDHSMLRITDTERYDKGIENFVNKIYNQ